MFTWFITVLNRKLVMLSDPALSLSFSVCLCLSLSLSTLSALSVCLFPACSLACLLHELVLLMSYFCFILSAVGHSLDLDSGDCCGYSRVILMF